MTEGFGRRFVRSHLPALAVALLVASACASANLDQPVQSKSIAGLSGNQILTRYCADCHAVGRHDTSRHRDAPAFRTLSRRYPIESLGESLSEGIVVGHPDMPEFQFDPHAVESIIDYLQSIQER